MYAKLKISFQDLPVGKTQTFTFPAFVFMFAPLLWSFSIFTLSKGLSHMRRQAVYTLAHSFPPLSLQSLIKQIMTVRFGGLQALLFALSFRVFPQTTISTADVTFMGVFA